MAKNDVILLDGIIDQRVAAGWPSEQRDEVFEFFVIEEVLKDYDLSVDEIESGWIDGRNDGGFDGFYILINGRLLEDTEDFVWPRSHASIDIWLITCKHHDTFLQAPLDAILATIQELFNLSRAKDQLHGSYSEELLNFRSLFHLAYRRLSIGRPLVRFNVVYASRGDSSQLGESVAARARQIEATVTGLFSSCSVEFRFVGASELVDLHRRSKTFSLNLPFLEHLATGKDSYVLLVRLDDYWRFVADENGNLRRYLFDSNVRDFLGTTGVNDDIERSLKDITGPDFWWLNNGVTILATNATVPGKTIQLQDIQIVNGLQTTESIFRHFKEGSSESRDRCLLVKIIVSSDARARDQIIRATNNQNPVEIAALHATDKVQRDIEEILERHSWYYERRRNYYRNIGKPQARLVTPMYLASAVVSLVFRNPGAATRLRTRFMRKQESYDSVFSSTLPIAVWPVLVDVYKLVDAGLLAVAASQKRGERFLSNFRPIVSLLLTARALGRFSYDTKDLAILDTNSLQLTDVQAAWNIVADVQGAWDAGAPGRRERRLRQSFFITCCEEAARRYGLEGVNQVGRRGIFSTPTVDLSAAEPLTPEFVTSVDALLPQQPWKPGMHLDVAAKLGCKPIRVTAAVQQLIAEGKRSRQHNGVVYDAEGNVLIIDYERVRPGEYSPPNNLSGSAPGALDPPASDGKGGNVDKGTSL